MAFSIDYSIKDGDLRNLELIFETNGNLQVLRMNPDWSALLERQAGLKEAVSSIGVEGTVLTMDQAKAITVGESSVEVGEKERREFVGYYDSLQYIKDHIDHDLTVGFLLAIHEKVTAGDEKAFPGKIRLDSRSIKSNGRVVYMAPPYNQLDVLLKEFISWFNEAIENENISPIIAAGICHFWFVWIHPFCDGNGRVSRLLTTFLLLKKKSEGIRYFALSDYYNRHKDDYCNALEQTNICNPRLPAMNFDKDLTPWLSFFIQSYLSQMGEVREVTNRILQLNIRVTHLRKDGLINDGHNKVLSFLSSREKASYQELTDHLGGVSRQRVHQILSPLREASILIEEKIGKKLWFKLGSPEIDPDETIFKKKLKRKSVEKVKQDPTVKGKQAVLPIFNF